MTTLLADADPIVAHTAVQALRSLRAVAATLAVVDSPTAAPAQSQLSIHTMAISAMAMVAMAK